jgi:phosphoglycolate phosphatase
VRFEAVIFDLDGTLADTLDDIACAMNGALVSLGLPPHPNEAYRHLVGEGAEHLARRALPPGQQAQVPEAVRRFRQHYAEHVVARSRPFDDIPPLLDALTARGVAMAVLSNKLDALTRRIVELCFGRWPLWPVHGEREGVPRKPDPRAALGIAAELGVVPGRCLFVGDTGVDMRTAAAAGMYGVGVLWGFRGRDELASAGARAIIARPQELLALL